MTTRALSHVFKLSVLTAATLLALSARASLQEPNRGRLDRDDDHQGRDDDDRREHQSFVRLPTGQIVTPTAIDDAVQQYLNPGLPQYPNFVAGEAVRSRLTSDGTTLAVITAGQNSLYKPDGTVDVANSTQYIFLYTWRVRTKRGPS